MFRLLARQTVTARDQGEEALRPGTGAGSRISPYVSAAHVASPRNQGVTPGSFGPDGRPLNARGQQRPMTPRPGMTRGCPTPAAEDLAALTTAGQDPTVLAFALGRAPGRVLYEVLNQAEPMTQVYRADGADGLAAVNRALDDAGFRDAPPSLALAGQVPHDAQWPDRIAALLR